jgi:receptor protein-tyrosine kinase
VNPREKLILGVALLGALLLGALATLGLERLDATITSVEQLRPLSLALLGTLPTIPRAQDQRRAPDRHILDYPDAPFGQAVAALRDGLVRANVLARRATVLLASARADEGTTTTALSLARCHARAGGHPLLIDCDLAKPRLQTLTGAADGEGLADVLRGERALEEVLRRDERSGARLVTAGNAAAGAGALLASDTMQSLMREAAAGYDMVILDGPPVLAGPDARALARIADGTVLLARWGHTRREDVIAAAEVLIGAGADMAGLVLTCAKPGKVASQVGANLVQASPA